MHNRLQGDLGNILARTEPLWHDLRGGRILITGATGFFGCWLLESFAWANRRLGLGARAVALARHPEVLVQKAYHLSSDPAITLHPADVRRGDFPEGEFSHVIHAATAASAQLNRDSPLLMFDTIVEGTRRTLNLAIARSTSKFLFVSSGAVYGSQPPHLTHLGESFDGGPDSLDRNAAYAEGKRAAEMLCALSANPRLAVTIARCFAFVGPYMPLDAHFAIGNFISDALRGDVIRVKGDGSPFRSYLYASDLAVWLWTVLFQGKSGQAYNVGSEDALSIAAIANAVAAAVPRTVHVSFASGSKPNGPAHRYIPSTARARTELGLTAEIPLYEAIRRTYDWFTAPALRPPFELARGTHA
jgi:nucleoside-diphosphate-sugar epimerase